MNKKGFILGWKWIISFFLILLFMTFIVFLVDVAKVEFFDPATDTIRNLTENVTGSNTSIYVLKQNEIHNTTDNVSLPYNLILIIITFIIVFASIYDATQQEKQGIISLLVSTMGGIAFLLYIIHLFVFGMLDYFQVQVIGQLFSGLIDTHLPFYNVVIENWWLVFIWALIFQGANYLFGKDPEDSTGGISL